MSGTHYYHPETLELIDGDLRAARKVGGLPSPTTVLKVVTSPGLINYFRRQMWEAATTTPRTLGMSDDEHFRVCERWANEHGQSARDKGGAFHDEVQRFLLDKLSLRTPEAQLVKPQVSAYMGWHGRNIRRSIAVEKPVRGQGYAGRLDHYAELFDGRRAVLDPKTQDISKNGNFNHYLEWALQLGAYAGALPKEAPVDVLISVCVSSMPGEVVIEAYEWPMPWTYYHGLFMGLLAFWRELHNYHQ